MLLQHGANYIHAFSIWRFFWTSPDDLELEEPIQLVQMPPKMRKKSTTKKEIVEKKPETKKFVAVSPEEKAKISLANCLKQAGM